ncbi:MAG: PAS domain S-box protein [Bryobacteraceae bacterium]|nr:PAS domain S-box protein [Bryobacteraceae bacterium]
MAEELPKNITHRLFIALFFLTAVIICVGGYRFYAAQRDEVQGEVANNLQAIADLKAEQVVAWRRERFGDARVITADPALLRAFHAIVAGRAPSGGKQETLQWLADFRDAYGYANAILVDATGKEFLRQGRVYGSSAHFAEILAEMSTAKKVIVRDLHSEREGAEHLGLNVPLQLPGSKQLFGMLSFAIDPEQHLFPMVDRWPGPRRVGETLLVRRNGADALYLDNRVGKNKAGSRTHLGLDKNEAIALKALHGDSGLVRGIDREGRPVVAAVRSIPDSQWLILAQIPLEAINQPIRDRVLPISLAVVSLILAAGIAAAYLVRAQERRQEEAWRGAELEKQALASHYNYLSRSVNDAILLMDDQGVIVEANDYASVMYGYSREQMLGMNIAGLRAAQDLGRMAEQWRRVQLQSSALFETVHARKDGSTFPVEVSSLAITVEGRHYHQSIIRDITQRNLAKKQLENANRLYAVLSQCNQAILGAATDREMFDAVCNAAVQGGGFPLAMIVRLDRESGDVQPVAIAGAARSYAQSIHISAREDPFGQGGTGTAFRSGNTSVIDDMEHDLRMLPWRERARQTGLRSSITVLIQRGGRMDFAFVMYSREAAFFNAEEVKLIEEVAAKISYALGRLDEESGRKAAEEALRISEERYRQLVEQSPIGMYVHTGGIVRYMNAKALELLGFRSLDKVAGMSIYNFIHPDDREMVRERVRTLNTGGVNPLIDERFTRPDGSVVYLEVSAVQIVFDGDKSTFVFCIDATQRKKAEEERARMEEQFLQAQKMESIGRLAGGVAHDFNNNLTVINGYCDLLLASLPSDDPVRKEISQISKAGSQAAAMTRQLLTFSRRQSFSPQRADLNEIVTETKSLLGRLLGEQIRFEARLSPALPGVFADPTQLHQVLMNLVINARDAMPGGGDITIETSSVHLDEEQAARTVGARAGEFVMLTVRDTGAGMDAETKRHIFEPFFTTKPRGSGTGLGLATVYGIVRQSDGWVEVQSTPGEGSTFRIVLPAVTGAEAPSAEVSTAAAPGRETILLVEDQPDVRLLTMTILESLGYVVLEADCGVKALEISKRNPSQIDLLLTDVIMPGITGPELAKRLRVLRPSIKVLFVSGYAEDGVMSDGDAASGFQLLPKPFTPTALAAKVREMLHG